MSDETSDEIDPNCECQDCSQERWYRAHDCIATHCVVVSPHFAPVIRESEVDVPKDAPRPGPRVDTIQGVIQWLTANWRHREERVVATFYACNGDSEEAARDYITQLCKEYVRAGLPAWADFDVNEATAGIEATKARYDAAVAHFKAVQQRRDSWRTVLSCHGLIEAQEAPVETDH